MTLKEKLKKEGFSHIDYLSNVVDDFAIGFAEWVDDKGLEVVLSQKPKNTKELLTIYKKEKGL
jgi:hypothetical protein